MGRCVHVIFLNGERIKKYATKIPSCRIAKTDEKELRWLLEKGCDEKGKINSHGKKVNCSNDCNEMARKRIAVMIVMRWQESELQ